MVVGTGVSVDVRGVLVVVIGVKTSLPGTHRRTPASKILSNGHKTIKK